MAQLTPDGGWITPKDMQQMLSLGRSKTYEILAMEEGIETVQIGTAIRINKVSLEHWLMTQRYPKWREDHSDISQGG